MHYIYYTCYSIKIILQVQQQPTYSIPIKPFSYPVVNILIQDFYGKRQKEHF